MLAGRVPNQRRTYWIDRESLDLSADVPSQLVHAIRSARTVMLIDTPSARHSSWVEFELSVAALLGVPVHAITPLLG